MDLELKGKRAVVTGSTAGIGFAIAKRLAAEGAAVVVNGRTEKRVNTAIEQIRGEHPRANLTGVAADISNAAGCAKLADTVPTTEILVNNMGIFEPKPFEKIPDEDWMLFFEANVMSGVRLSRHYLGGMREQN
jgi:NAD(P)-dependent dehydrogenase (short-subunit alcohol dehydrogenase family)